MVTKLTATLSPDDMRKDVWLDWRPFQEKGDEVFSLQGARTYSLNIAAGLVAVWLALTWIAFGRNRHLLPPFRAVAFLALALCLIFSAGIYLFLPKTEVRLVRRPYRQAYSNAVYAYNSLCSDNGSVSNMLTNASGDNGKGIQLLNPYDRSPLENLLLGGLMKKEDSPGNFTIRKTSEGFEFVCYDMMGGEHVMGPLP